MREFMPYLVTAAVFVCFIFIADRIVATWEDPLE